MLVFLFSRSVFGWLLRLVGFFGLHGLVGFICTVGFVFVSCHFVALSQEMPVKYT